MAEYDENGNEIEDGQEEKSIWELMDVDEPSDEYEDEQEEQDEETAKLQKLERKFSAKMDQREKQFEGTILRERVGQYESRASDLERDLFKTLASDIKTLADFDKATKLVAARAQKMEAATEAYRKQMEEAAASQASSAWGTGPIGTPQKRTPDLEAEQMKKIASGDSFALLQDLIGNDAPWLD